MLIFIFVYRFIYFRWGISCRQFKWSDRSLGGFLEHCHPTQSDCSTHVHCELVNSPAKSNLHSWEDLGRLPQEDVLHRVESTLAEMEKTYKGNLYPAAQWKGFGIETFTREDISLMGGYMKCFPQPGSKSSLNTKWEAASLWLEPNIFASSQVPLL